MGIYAIGIIDNSTYDRKLYFHGHGENHSQSSSSSLSVNQWYHIAYVYDGSTGKLYINGVLKDSASYTLSTTDSKVLIGIGRAICDPGECGWNNYFNGTIDELRIYDRALSSQEIQTQYQTN